MAAWEISAGEVSARSPAVAAVKIPASTPIQVEQDDDNLHVVVIGKSAETFQ
ncbi:hypothetical protein COLO4_13730 [Corchorus olitorius]|uniref:Uncharacterized protein n=1 Tax=Corchorus olitorius TaxID=93759 RepID=A0A1R3JVB4_9ROSI|nr:hypothetical protein COLO4_13730 [Corchorus olitorius]